MQKHVQWVDITNCIMSEYVWGGFVLQIELFLVQARNVPVWGLWVLNFITNKESSIPSTCQVDF